MSRRLRTLSLVIALAVIAVFFVVAGLASAGDKETACVVGLVIDHTEKPVNGTLTQPPLVVEAVSGGAEPAVKADVNTVGMFRFDKLAVGDWNFRLQLPSEWEGIVPIAPDSGLAQTGMTKLTETKKDCHKVLFKIRRKIPVIVIKWEELLDGSVQPGVGWEFKATSGPIPFDPFNNGPQTEVTDASGAAHFTLTPGQWTITEKLKPGWINVVPGMPPFPPAVVVKLGQYDPPGARPPVVFKNRECPCHDGKIIVKKLGFGTDVNGKEVPLGPLSGWDVFVDSVPPSPGFPRKLTTNFMGEATFINLTPGVYVVWEVIPLIGGLPAWEEMDDKASQYVVLTDCEEPITVTFNNKELRPKLRIRGTKTMTPGGYGLAGWTIIATQPGTGVKIETKTDAFGNYEFTEAELDAAGMAFPGAPVNVTEELPPGWDRVAPPGGICRLTFPHSPPPGYTGEWCHFVNKQETQHPSRPPKPIKPPTCEGPGPDCRDDRPHRGCDITYTVKPGDTLARIAASYGTTAGAVAGANGIKNLNVIRTGQIICVK